MDLTVNCVTVQFEQPVEVYVPHSIDSIKSEFTHYFLSTEQYGSIFNKLEKLNITSLKVLRSAYDTFFFDGEALSAEQSEALNTIRPSTEAINSFIEQCYKHYGKAAITQGEQNLKYQTTDFDSYQALIQYLGTNCLTILANPIREKILSCHRAILQRPRDKEGIELSEEPSSPRKKRICLS